MKRDAGIVGGLAAVLMIFGLSGRQKQGPANLPAGSGEHRAVYGKKPVSAKTKQDQNNPYQPCVEILDQLRRFVADSEKADSKTLPESCYAQKPTNQDYLRAFSGVTFAIATVPDPVSTHLPLIFDRFVESIQQAAQDDGYSYDGSWFPWDTASKDYAYLDDQLEAEKLQEIQQAQPGVMLFRHGDEEPYHHGLVVFLVGEKPTGGLSGDQFNNALAWLLQLGNSSSPENAKQLRILGPSFSGSLPSLQSALEHNLDQPYTLGAYRGKGLIQVSSGSVSSGHSFKVFDDWITGPSHNGYFRTAMENDDLVTERFCRYLETQGYHHERVAELSEDETAFGRLESKPCPALSLYYPRDIATVRSAYQQQSIFGSTKTGANPEAPSTRLRGDLSEPPGTDNDTVRHYAGSLTPVEQESILVDITHRLSENRVQFVILRATNSLDQIFLSEFLQQAYPEGRVVIDGDDLLFTEGSWGGSLRGVMVLSTYPLLTLEPDWTSSLLTFPKGAYRAFGADTSEEVYIAARELFGGPNTTTEVPISDYSPPAWARNPDDSNLDNERPATWVTVIGHRRFWPLAFLNDYTLNDGATGTSILPPSCCRGDPRIQYGDPELPEFPVVMWVLLTVCFLWACVHFCFCALPSMVRSPRARAYFVPLPRWEHPALIAFGGLLVAMLAVVVAACSGWFAWRAGTVSYSYQRPPTGTLLWCWFSFVLLASLSGTLLNYWPKPLEGGGQPGPSARSRQLLAFVAAALCWDLVLYFYVNLAHSLSAANQIPAYWRSLNLLSGVSPLLPQLLLIAALYIWFWCTLRGLAHFGDDRPLLPSENDLPLLPVVPGIAGTPIMPMFGREEAGEPVEEAARPLGRHYLLTFGVAFLLTIFGCWIALQDWSVRSLGERRFGTFMFFWVCLCIAIILANAVQLWRVWSKLRYLLVHLDRLPLRRTLRALKGLEWGSIWKVSGNVLEERYRVISLQVESLRHLKNALALQLGEVPIEEERIGVVLAQVDSCLDDVLPKLADWYVGFQKTGSVKSLRPLCNFQEELASTAGLVMRKILQPEWRLESESLIFDHSNSDGKSLGDKAEEQAGASAGPVPAHVRAVEEFFVLPYLAFIQNALGRMRTIVLGTLWLFVGTTLAVSSYPFQPLNVLGGIFLTVFVLVGGVTIIVYLQMCRDATLSHITHTTPGEVGWEFWMRLAAFGIGPLLGLLTTLFPSISDFIFSWFQPGMEALR